MTNTIPADSRYSTHTLEVPLGKIIDETDSNNVYIGWCVLGDSIATSAAKWRICKIIISGTITAYQWADGNAKFDNIWDNRASLTYSY